MLFYPFLTQTVFASDKDISLWNLLASTLSVFDPKLLLNARLTPAGGELMSKGSGCDLGRGADRSRFRLKDRLTPGLRRTTNSCGWVTRDSAAVASMLQDDQLLEFFFHEVLVGPQQLDLV